MNEHGRRTPATTGAESRSTPAVDARDALAYDRTHLANERTFAAWLRTGLSVAAGGIAVAHLVPEPARDSWIALTLGAAFVLLGVAVIAYGARQFARVAKELNRDSGRRSPAPTRTVYGLTAIIAGLLLAVLLFLWSHRGIGGGAVDGVRIGSSGVLEPVARWDRTADTKVSAALPIERSVRIPSCIPRLFREYAALAMGRPGAAPLSRAASRREPSDLLDSASCATD